MFKSTKSVNHPFLYSCCPDPLALKDSCLLETKLIFLNVFDHFEAGAVPGQFLVHGDTYSPLMQLHVACPVDPGKAF